MATVSVSNSGKTTLLSLGQSKAVETVIITPDGDDLELFINGETAVTATARDGDPTPISRRYGITKVEAQAISGTAAVYVNQAGN